ncbi:MAG: 4Fe-4S binding protein [Acidobacteriota bacterium]
MARKITDKCISCGSCADVCPDGAVSEGRDTYVVDAARCKDCGKCEKNCQEDAIVADRKQPAPASAGAAPAAGFTGASAVRAR